MKTLHNVVHLTVPGVRTWTEVGAPWTAGRQHEVAHEIASMRWHEPDRHPHEPGSGVAESVRTYRPAGVDRVAYRDAALEYDRDGETVTLVLHGIEGRLPDGGRARLYLLDAGDGTLVPLALDRWAG